MSELNIFGWREYKRKDLFEDTTDEIREADRFYIMHDADNVIIELKDKRQNVSSLLKETREWLVESQKMHKRCADNAGKIIRHNKYKRCLAMQNMCRYAQYSYSYLMENESCKILPNNIDFRRYNKKYHFYIRWRKRWM